MTMGMGPIRALGIMAIVGWALMLGGCEDCDDGSGSPTLPPGPLPTFPAATPSEVPAEPTLGFSACPTVSVKAGDETIIAPRTLNGTHSLGTLPTAQPVDVTFTFLADPDVGQQVTYAVSAFVQNGQQTGFAEAKVTSDTTFLSDPSPLGTSLPITVRLTPDTVSTSQIAELVIEEVGGECLGEDEGRTYVITIIAELDDSLVPTPTPSDVPPSLPPLPTPPEVTATRAPTPAPTAAPTPIPEPTATASRGVMSAPATVTLPRKDPGVRFSVTYRISNSGPGPLELGSFKATSQVNCKVEFVDFNGEALLASGEDVEVQAILTITALGDYGFNVDMAHDGGPGGAVTTVVLTGTSAVPNIDALTPDAIGAILGEQVQRDFTLNNDGDGKLFVTGLTIECTGCQESFEPLYSAEDPLILQGGTTERIRLLLTALSERFTLTFTFNSNDPDTPVKIYQVPVTATDAPEPEVSVFREEDEITSGADNAGSVAPQTQLDFTYVIKNTGTADLTLGAPTLGTLENTTAFFVAPTPASTVAPGGSTTLSLRVVPTDYGAFTAPFSFTTNDSDENPVAISVFGVAEAPDIDVQLRYELGDVAIGEVRSVEARVTNLGTLPLNVIDVRVRENSPQNCAAQVNLGVDDAIPAGLFDVVSVQVTPTAAGAFSAVFEIESNDPDEAIDVFEVSGVATAGEDCSDPNDNDGDGQGGCDDTDCQDEDECTACADVDVGTSFDIGIVQGGGDDLPITVRLKVGTFPAGIICYEAFLLQTDTWASDSGVMEIRERCDAEPIRQSSDYYFPLDGFGTQFDVTVGADYFVTVKAPEGGGPFELDLGPNVSTVSPGEDLGDAVGAELTTFSGFPDALPMNTTCNVVDPDYKIQWTAPSTGTFEVMATPTGGSCRLRLGVTDATACFYVGEHACTATETSEPVSATFEAIAGQDYFFAVASGSSGCDGATVGVVPVGE